MWNMPVSGFSILTFYLFVCLLIYFTEDCVQRICMYFLGSQIVTNGQTKPVMKNLTLMGEWKHVKFHKTARDSLIKNNTVFNSRLIKHLEAWWPFGFTSFGDRFANQWSFLFMKLKIHKHLFACFYQSFPVLELISTMLHVGKPPQQTLEQKMERNYWIKPGWRGEDSYLTLERWLFYHKL